MKKLLSYGVLLLACIGLASFAYSKLQNQNLSISQQSSVQELVTEDAALTTLKETPRESKDQSESARGERREKSSISSREKEGEEVELDFDYLDLDRVNILDQDNQAINLPQKFGKPMVINVWATWCPPCRTEMLYFQKAWEGYQDEVDFYMINATNSQPNETIEKVKDYLQELDLTLPVYYDSNFSAMISLQATFLPTTIFVDENGKVTYHQIGLISEEDLIDRINQLI